MSLNYYDIEFTGRHQIVPEIVESGMSFVNPVHVNEYVVIHNVEYVVTKIVHKNKKATLYGKQV